MKNRKQLIRVVALFFLFVFLSAAAAAMAADAVECRNSLEQEHLKGRVRSIQTIMVLGRPWPGSEPGTGPFTESKRWFDRDGFEIEGMYYVRGKLRQHVVIRRDRCRVIEREETKFDLASPRREVTTYDAEGQPAQTNAYALDGALRERRVFEKETDGVRELRYGATGQFVTQIFHTRKRAGDAKLSVEDSYANGALERRQVSEETEGAWRSETMWFAPDGSERMRQLKETTGKDSRSAIAPADGATLSFERDETGKAVQVVVYPRSRERRVLHYDATGRRTRFEDYSLGGSLRSAMTDSHVDDDHGNWIKVIETTNYPAESLNSTTTRSISYY